MGFERRELLLGGGVAAGFVLPWINAFTENDLSSHQWSGQTVADVDGDGVLEIVLTGKNPGCSIYQYGFGRLSLRATIATDTPVLEAIAIQDINADGKQELVMSGFGRAGSPTQGGVEVWQWDGVTATKLSTAAWGSTNAVGSWALVVGQLGVGAPYQIAVGWDDGAAGTHLGLRVYSADLATMDTYTWTDAGSPGANNWAQPGIIGDVVGDGSRRLVTVGRDGTQHGVVKVWSWSSGVAPVLVSTVTETTVSGWHSAVLADVNGDAVNEIILAGWIMVAGRHTARIKVFSLNFASVIAEVQWDNGGDTEVWYTRPNNQLPGAAGINDITVFGGSYGYGSQFFGAYRLRGGTLSRLFVQRIALQSNFDSLVVESGNIGDFDGDGSLEAVVDGWWSLALAKQASTRDVWVTVPVPAFNQWWEAGGATGCLAAYTPKGAKNYRFSLWDQSGTYKDILAGVAPTWDAVNGWKFNGTTQYLNTGLAGTAVLTAVVKFSNAGTVGAVFGTYSSATSKFRLYPFEGNTVSYDSGTEVSVAPGLTSGVLGIAGQQGWRNGSKDGGAIPVGAGNPVQTILIGANHINSSIGVWCAVYVQAIAFYSGVLSDAQMAAVMAAMAAL